jgi:hypothetical protein
MYRFVSKRSRRLKHELLNEFIFKKYGIFLSKIKSSKIKFKNLFFNRYCLSIPNFTIPIYMATAKVINRVKFYGKRRLRRSRLRHLKFGSLGTLRIKYYKQ